MSKQHASLTKVIKVLLTGTALSAACVSSASAHVMYNTYNHHTTYLATDAGDNGTDGWVWGFGGTSGGNSANTNPGWVGTSNGDAPFGYVGAPILNWAATLHSPGGALEVSQQDAYDDYGVYADIDTAGGAWRDASGTGWKHNTDIGLFKSEVTQYVHLNLSAINGPIANFGVTVFEGMATNLTGYSHHGPWNNAEAGTPYLPPLKIPVGVTNPFGNTGLDTVVGYDDSVDSVNAFTFLAEAGVVYTIALGGSGGLHWNQQHDGYVLDITSSPVPVPGAVWLFGSALAGLIGMRRKTAATS